MGFCEELIKRKFPTEFVFLRPAATGLDALLSECGGLENVSRQDAMIWAADAGLNVVSCGRKFRVFSAACQEAGVSSVLDGVTFEDLDFSEDLEKHFFPSYSEMMSYVDSLLLQIDTRREDATLLSEALVTLMWDGIPQNHIVLLDAGDAPNPNRLVLTCGGNVYPISPASYLLTKELFDRRLAEAGTDAPLFANKGNGARWSVSNTGDKIYKLSTTPGPKEIQAAKLRENGLFCRIADYIKTHRGASVREAAEMVSNNSQRKTQSAVREFYHWQKYYNIS